MERPGRPGLSIDGVIFMRLPCGHLPIHDADAWDIARLPLRKWSLMAAIEAGCLFKSSGTLRADAPGLESIKLGFALVATPDWADGRSGSATGTGKTLAARDLFEVAQGTRGLESIPAVHSGVSGDQGCPNGMGQHG